MHRREINKISSLVNEKGHTLVPLSMYWKNGNVKVSIGLAKGRKKQDKDPNQGTRLEASSRPIKEA